MKHFPLADGAFCELHERWIAEEPAEQLMRALLGEVPWAAREIEIYGRKVLQPRLVAWVGDENAVYTYSRTRHVPLPWTPHLAQLRCDVQGTVGAAFNSVLCNLYRDGHDSMGMHSDREPELGPNPIVASVSLGAPRRFRLRHRNKASSGNDLDLELGQGSLLVMAGTTQHFYRHGVPKQASVTAPRINLTFRAVQPLADAPGMAEGAHE
jgi:alkylated DNA repair dioxygenase AlkB